MAHKSREINTPEVASQSSNGFKDFQEEVFAIPGGETIRRCQQCGQCSGSCAFAAYMEHTPRMLIAMTRAGLREEVLRSSSMWFCASCYLCTARCPSGVEITHFMHGLQLLANTYGLASPATPVPRLYRAIMESVKSNGRVHELGAMMRFYSRSSPVSALKELPTALSLLRKGRLSLRPKRIKGARELAAIIEKAESGGVK